MPGMYIGRGGISEEHLYPALHAIFRTMFHPLSGLQVPKEQNILKFVVKKGRKMVACVQQQPTRS